jgi:hypothetical protein
MRTLYLLALVSALVLSGCATTNPCPKSQTTNSSSSAQCPHKKDPITVSFLSNQKPARPYQVIGTTVVAKYNTVGIKRQEAIIRDLIRQQAASLGGDAVIDVKHNGNAISATVIAYKQVLV